MKEQGGTGSTGLFTRLEQGAANRRAKLRAFEEQVRQENFLDLPELSLKTAQRLWYWYQWGLLILVLAAALWWTVQSVMERHERDMAALRQQVAIMLERKGYGSYDDVGMGIKSQARAADSVSDLAELLTEVKNLAPRNNIYRQDNAEQGGYMAHIRRNGKGFDAAQAVKWSANWYRQQPVAVNVLEPLPRMGS